MMEFVCTHFQQQQQQQQCLSALGMTWGGKEALISHSGDLCNEWKNMSPLWLEEWNGRKNHFRSKEYNLSYFIARLLLSQTAPCSETDLISSCTGMWVWALDQPPSLDALGVRGLADGGSAPVIVILWLHWIWAKVTALVVYFLAILAMLAAVLLKGWQCKACLLVRHPTRLKSLHNYQMYFQAVLYRHWRFPVDLVMFILFLCCYIDYILQMSFHDRCRVRVRNINMNIWIL